MLVLWFVSSFGCELVPSKIFSCSWFSEVSVNALTLKQVGRWRVLAKLPKFSLWTWGEEGCDWTDPQQPLQEVRWSKSSRRQRQWKWYEMVLSVKSCVEKQPWGNCGRNAHQKGGGGIHVRDCAFKTADVSAVAACLDNAVQVLSQQTRGAKTVTFVKLRPAGT